MKVKTFLTLLNILHILNLKIFHTINHTCQMSIIHYGFYNNSYLSNIIFILLSERQHYDSLPVFKPSSDDMLIELRNSSQVLVVYFEGREIWKLNFGREFLSPEMAFWFDFHNKYRVFLALPKILLVLGKYGTTWD